MSLRSRPTSASLARVAAASLSASAVLAGAVLVAVPASAATNVDYTTRQIAGTGSSGCQSSPTPGPAVQSEFCQSQGSAVASNGDLYFSDSGYHLIYKVSAGVLSVVAGGAGAYGTATPALQATLRSPSGMDLVGDDLYFADGGRAGVFKLSVTTGALTRVAGNSAGTYTTNSNGLPTFGGQATATAMGYPTDVAVDRRNGDIYLSDNSGAVEKVTAATGVLSLVAGNPSGVRPTTTPAPATARNIGSPDTLALAPDGTVYVGDRYVGNQGVSAVYEVGADGLITSFAGNGSSGAAGDGPALSQPLSELRSLRVDAAGRLYLATKSQIVTIDRTGDLEVIAGTGSLSPSPTFGVASTTSTVYSSSALSLGPDCSIYFSTGVERYIAELEPRQPCAPAAPTASAGDGTATVTWPASTAAGASPVTGYAVTPYMSGVAQTPRTFTTAATTQTLTGLTNGASYTFTVTPSSLAGSGDPSAPSNAVTPAASPPGGGGGAATPLLSQTVTITAPASVALQSASVRLGATASAGGVLAFSSSAPAVASVDGNGVMTLRSAGTTTITVTAAATATHAPASASVAITVSAPGAVSLPTGAVRLSGGDRVATAATVSAQVFADPGTGEYGNAVIATSATFADSIAGTRLAGQVGGPLLLTGTDELDSRVAAEVRRLVRRGGTVYILGQDRALSVTVQDALRSLSTEYGLERLGGADRYATAVEIADEVVERAGDVGPIYLVTGQDFADGVSVGAYAQRTGGVVLLTSGDRLPEVTAAYLAAHDPRGDRIVAVGGAAAAAASAAGYIAAAGRAVVGVDRYETSAMMARAFADLTTAANPSGGVASVGIAGGASWPDALAGSAAVAHLDGPLLLTPTGSSRLSGSTTGVLEELAPDADRVVVFGGPSAVSDAAMSRIGGLVG